VSTLLPAALHVVVEDLLRLPIIAAPLLRDPQIQWTQGQWRHSEAPIGPTGGNDPVDQTSGDGLDTEQYGPVHHASGRGVVRCSPVHRSAVVPDHHVTYFPVVVIDIFGSCCMRGQFCMKVLLSASDMPST